MDQVYIRANQLADAADILNNVIPNVKEKFQLKRMDIAAGLTGTGCTALCRIAFAVKSLISVFNQL